MVTRRTVLQLSVAAVAASALHLGRAWAQPLPVRRSLHEMDLDDPVLVAFRDFVTRMKDPARNGQPVSWVSFSNIHGTSAGFNFCPHGNWYFLPWHRGYVHMYEQAVRNLTGMQDFAMPYWDWTAHPDFPAAFGDENFDGQPNPLFVPGRDMVTGTPVPTDVSGPGVLATIMGQPTFEEFGTSRATGQNSTDPSWIRRRGIQGVLESTPHNIIHCTVNGPFMCAAISPQDPIFQMHHCNIDRIWDAWNREGKTNSSSELWLNMAFQNNYIAPDGSSYSWQVSDLLSVDPLGYTYVPQPAEPEPEPEPEPAPEPQPYPGRDLYLQYLVNGEAFADNAMIAMPLSARSDEVSASPDKPADVTLETTGLNLGAVRSEAVTSALTDAGMVAPRAKLLLREVKPELPDHTVLRVFVNTPDASAETPTSDNPNYVGAIGFFGTGPGGVMLMEGMDGMEHDQGMAEDGPSMALDIPATAFAPEANSVTVQLVPVALGSGAAAGPVIVTQLELAVL